MRVLVPQLRGCFIFDPSTMWTLQALDPEEVGLTFRLLPGTFKTLGRASRADFVVDTPLVSRVHCRFTLSDSDELELEDLGSTNGTFVNGQKVTKTLLNHGDTLTIGRVRFVVNANGAQERDSPTTLS